MRNKVKLFFISILLLFNLTGCSNNSKKESSPVEINAESKSKTQNENIYKQEFRFMNNNISFPFKLNDILNIQADENTAFETESSCIYSSIWFNELRLGRVMISDCHLDDKDINDKDIVYLRIEPDFVTDDFDFDYQGLTIGSSKDEILNKMGEPDEDTGKNMKYYFDNDIQVEFSLSSKDILYSFTITNYEFFD